jgi:putative transposase
MKASKFMEAQIAFVLKQAADGTAVGEVCRKAEISDEAFYTWRKRYAGLVPSKAKRLRQLEEENGKLMRIVADQSLDKAMLQDMLSEKGLRPERRRRLVDEVRAAWKVSVRNACAVLRIDRSLYTDKSRRGDQPGLKKRIKEATVVRVRYGYRRFCGARAGR